MNTRNRGGNCAKCSKLIPGSLPIANLLRRRPHFQPVLHLVILFLHHLLFMNRGLRSSQPRRQRSGRPNRKPNNQPSSKNESKPPETAQLGLANYAQTCAMCHYQSPMSKLSVWEATQLSLKWIAILSSVKGNRRQQAEVVIGGGGKHLDRFASMYKYKWFEHFRSCHEIPMSEEVVFTTV